MVVQVLLSIAAFCIATNNPVLLVLAGAVGVASWTVAHGPRGRPLPRRWLNFGAALATLGLAWLVFNPATNLLVTMGYFTLVLQLLLLYAGKTAREYAQLLVISVVQLIGASVLSVSMSYAVLLMAYCAVGMATLMLFHLRSIGERVTAEHTATGGIGGSSPRPRFNHTAGRGARRALRRTGLAALLTTVAVACVVFVALPRTKAARANVAFNVTPHAGATSTTGFSPEVRLGNGPLGSGSQEPVLHLRVRDGATNMGHADIPWLVRGMALDHYNPETFRWRRSALGGYTAQPVPPHGFIHDSPPVRAGGYTADITVRRGGPSIVFGVVESPVVHSAPGFRPLHFSSQELPPVSYQPLDQQLSCRSPVPAGASYQLQWPRSTAWFSRPATEEHPQINPVGIEAWTAAYQLANRPVPLAGDAPLWPLKAPPAALDTYARGWVPHADAVRQTALQALHEAGLRRDPEARRGDNDARAATVLARHLSARYTYSLENPPPPPGQDPVIRFLYDTRRGHCELFAAGLVALCRSVGIPARMVVGFRASEYSDLGGYYVVRQSHAHAWTEVDAGPGIGWITLDPTPAAPVAEHHAANAGLLAGIARAWEYLEFNWLRRVVGFDGQTRTAALNFISSVGSSTKAWFTGVLRPLSTRLPNAAGNINPAALAAAAASAGAGTLIIFLCARRRGRAAAGRPAAPDGGANLPAFYLRMQALLNAGGLRRRDDQTPRAFAHAVAHDHPALRDTLPALTETYYAVRFGAQTLDAQAQQEIDTQIAALAQALTPTPTAAPPASG